MQAVSLSAQQPSNKDELADSRDQVGAGVPASPVCFLCTEQKLHAPFGSLNI